LLVRAVFLKDDSLGVGEPCSGVEIDAELNYPAVIVAGRQDSAASHRRRPTVDRGNI